MYSFIMTTISTPLTILYKSGIPVMLQEGNRRWANVSHKCGGSTGTDLTVELVSIYIILWDEQFTKI